MKIAPVILAGGAGTRLWPLSNNEKPKQFHNLFGNDTLLTATLKRLASLNPDIYLISTSRQYEKMSKENMSGAGLKGVVLAEPQPKNTAPAVLYSAAYLSNLYEDSVMVVLPADHYIKNTDEFVSAIKKAITEAGKGSLVTIGIKPEYPETGYGYIKAAQGNEDALKVENFVEKPDKAKAEQYFQDGNYYWNAGMFIWKTSVILSYFKELMPELFNAFRPLMNISPKKFSSDDRKTYVLTQDIFNSIEGISIDYGIMEKAGNKKVIPADIGWTDLGSWTSIDETLAAGDNDNRTNNAGISYFLSSKNCSIFTEGKTIACIGLDNVIIAESGNNILVMNKNSTQEVRKLVEEIKERKNK